MTSPKKFALFTVAIAASVAVVGTAAIGCKAVTSNDDERATKTDGTGNGGEGVDGGTDPTVTPTAIDPQLVGTWSLVTTGAASQTTYYEDGTWLIVVVARGSISDIDVARKGNYRAEGGRIYYSDAVSQTSKDQGKTWSAWAPSATQSWEELYVIGTDEYGEYLIAEEGEITEDSVKYRRRTE
ncbi:MAG: hypothetical protein KF819_21870 [Labilithrix sp.]|nr:hypothetical protein [Labilithrix sp.]